MMKLTSAIRVTFAFAAITIAYGALAGSFQGCYEQYFDTVEPCIGPCNENAPACTITHDWTAYCAAGGRGCSISSYDWFSAPYDKYYCAAGSGEGQCVCGTGMIIEHGFIQRWTRDCNG